MKKFCPRLALLFLILISFSFIFSPKAQARAPYGSTWNLGAISSAIQVTNIATDSANNIYYAGTAVASVPIAFNPIDKVSDIQTATLSAIFITKINNDGTYGYTRLYDGADYITINSLKTDTNGNVYISGIFNGVVNFDPINSIDIKNSNGNNWSFLTKIDTNGLYQLAFAWENPLIEINELTIDVNNNVYLGGMVTSSTDSAQLDPISSSDNKILLANEQLGFYIKLNFDGTYAYSRSFLATSAASFSISHLVIDSNVNVYLTGNFSGTIIFDGPGGINSKTANGLTDAYVNKYDPSGNYLLTYTLGGSDNDFSNGIAVDHANNLFIFGTFNGTVNFNPVGGIDNITSNGADVRFLTKINADGTYAKTLTWNTTNSIDISRVIFDANDLIYIFGSATGNINFDPTGGTDRGTSYGFSDAFMTVLNADETYNYTYVWGGVGNEKALDGYFDTANNLYITGYTQSPTVNFDPTGGSNINALIGTTDGFITKLLTSQNIISSTSNTNNNQSSSGGGSGSFTCTNPWSSAPGLYQITSTNGKATLYFAPPADSQDGYTISYGVTSEADMYNVTFSYNDKSGAISYTINYLATGSTYYYKVRANNGCMPGIWSKTLSAKTPSTGAFTSYYSPTNSFNNGTTGGQCTQYTVLPGDSLWTIAQKLLASGRRYLEVWNNNLNTYPSLKNSSTIRTGWKLNVGC